MEFLVEIENRWPPDGDPVQKATLVKAEADRAQKRAEELLHATIGRRELASLLQRLGRSVGISLAKQRLAFEDLRRERGVIELECDEAQGYFFSPPQPASDLRGLIARTRTWRPPGAAVMRPAGGLRRSVS